MNVSESMLDHDAAKPPLMLMAIFDSKSLADVSNGHVNDIVPTTGAP